MMEQLTLWESIGSSRWFLKTNFVLVFTKIDELATVLEMFLASNHLHGFRKPDRSLDMSQRVDLYLAYLEDKFMMLVESEQIRHRTVVVHADLVSVGKLNFANIVVEACERRR